MKVLLTNTTRNAGIAAARSLDHAGCSVVGGDDRKLPFNACPTTVDSQYLLPEKGCDDLLPALLAIIEREKPDVFLPLGFGRDACKHQTAIATSTALLVPDYSSFEMAFNNRQTLEECHNLGIPCPRLYNEEEAQALLRQNLVGAIKNKVVIKPCEDYGGSQGVHILTDCQMLDKALAISRQRFGETILEEFIPGAEKMETANVMFDRESKLTHWFTTRKLRQFPLTGGLAGLSESTHRPELVRMVMPFFEKWCWKGPAEAEFVIDSRNNVAKLIEINPRFPGYIGFPIRCGLNLPYLLCRLSLGEKLELSKSPQYQAGIKYMNFTYFAKSALSELIGGGNRKQIIKNIVAELKGKKVNNNIGISDWQVVLSKTLYELKNLL